jgi:hypothetical protein
MAPPAKPLKMSMFEQNMNKRRHSPTFIGPDTEGTTLRWNNGQRLFWNGPVQGGAGYRIRTCDPVITNHVLYQLS